MCLKLAAGLMGCAALVGASAVAAPPKSEPAASPAPFGEQIDVRVVNLEAVVTDKAGKRVPDLKPSDLRLTVDGKPVPIEFFSEVRDGAAVAAAGAESAAVQGLPSLSPGSPVGTSYLVFIDDYFSLRARRDEMLRLVKADLARLGAEDRMAIVRYDGRKLELLSSWSQDKGDLSSALELALESRAHGIERHGELSSYDSSLRFEGERPGPAGLSPTSLSRQPREVTIGAAQSLLDQESAAVAAAAATLRTFANPPGRKVMLLLQGGWPFEPEDYLENSYGTAVVRRMVEGGEKLFRPLVDAANRLGYTIYPVDVPGDLRTSGREEQIHDMLAFAAGETGGRPVAGDLRGAPLAAAAADTRSYYWLGFTPSWHGNDKRHKIAVTAARPGLEIRVRGDFLDLSRQTDVSNQVESALLFGGSRSGGSAMQMQLGKPQKTKRNQMEVPVILAIPVAAVTPVPMQGEYVTELEVRVAARDKNGDRSEIPVIPVRFKTKKAPAADHFFKYETKLALRRIEQHVMLAVYDPLSQKITTAETDVAAP